jgi:transposase-like protein
MLNKFVVLKVNMNCPKCGSSDCCKDGIVKERLRPVVSLVG